MTVEPPVKAAVEAFFAALGNGDWAGASKFIHEPLEVFGATATRAEFARGQGKSISGAVRSFSSVPRAFFKDGEHLKLFAGPVPEGASICFAEVAVSGAPTTYGLIVEGALISRLFDPTEFKHFATSLDASRRGVEQVGWP